MIRGVTVTVRHPVIGTTGGAEITDRFGNPVLAAQTEETVGNVLVSPGGTADLEASRPEGVTVGYTLHFPKGYAASLEGCSVVLPAPWSCECRVVGDPRPYIDADTPTPWHLPVEVEVAHG